MKAVVLAALAGCGFTGGGATPGDAIDSSIDGPSDPFVTRDLPHLPATHEAPGEDAWSITGVVTVDTGTGVIDPTPSSGVHIDGVVMEGATSAPLAVIRAQSITLAPGSTLKVIGSRPLALVALRITVAGTLDVSADGRRPGPGGRLPGAPTSVNGKHSEPYHDAGGAGGGFGTAGAKGGTITAAYPCAFGSAQGGTAGAASGSPELDALEGGGGGGYGGIGTCSVAARGGGGGGAIQLSAYTAVSVATTGVIEAGGGGGEGGVQCQGSDDWGGGGGGGAGGAVYLDAPTVDISGTVAANGGGGGSGACTLGGFPGPGKPGDNAGSSLVVASGGDPVSTCGLAGGSGGVEDVAPIPGDGAACLVNAGGGGGAVGRIVTRSSTAVTGTGLVTPTDTHIGF